MTSFPHIAAIIPAAGLSSRFLAADNGTNTVTTKLVQRVGGRTVIERVVSVVVESGCQSCVVVTGHEEVQIRALLWGKDVSIVSNEAYETGMGSSIVKGVAIVPNADGYLILPADMPLVKLESVRTIIRAFRPTGIVAPVFDGRRGHPVLFSSRFRNELLQIDPSGGASPVLSANPGAVFEIEVADSGIHVDIDTFEDLQEAQLRINSDY